MIVGKSKCEYFGHQNLRFADNYFGIAGPKVYVSFPLYWLLRLFGYRVGKEKAGIAEKKGMCGE